jgi:hypothetical protein
LHLSRLERLPAALIDLTEDLTMGELLDALNALDDRGPPAEPVNPFDQAAHVFRAASQRVNEAIEAIQEPGMPLEHAAPLDATGSAAGLSSHLPDRRACHA